MKTLPSILTVACLLAVLDASAVVIGAKQQKTHNSYSSLRLKDLDIVRQDDSRLRVDMSLDARSLRISPEREIVYTPMLVNGEDTVKLASFIIAGRNRWLEHQRNDGKNFPLTVLRAGKVNEAITFSDDVPYRKWMETAELQIAQTECGCCSRPQAYAPVTVAQVDMTPREFNPEVAFVTPRAEAVKTRSINARAYVDFPVNITEIYPDYRRNPEELAKIRATIDSVRDDRDLTITSIHIKGFASPEGSYRNNERLAKGRTETLAGYVRGLYHFPRTAITTSFQPEDWQGLLTYVRSQQGADNLYNRDAIQALITDPRYAGRDDEREKQIKSRFPQDYAFLLDNVYPGLRHSDYTVNYNIRSYTSPEEIIATMKTAPQNLSLQELFVAANSVEPGSEIYNRAFDIAARLYPDDQTANLNAGFCALQRNDLKMAERYFMKAGNSEQAAYGRAILEAKNGDKEAALQTMKTLHTVPQAQQAAEILQHNIETSGNNYRLVNDHIGM